MIQRFLSLSLAESLLAPAGVDVMFLDETGSTNDDLKAVARRRAFEKPLLEVALSQRAARGTKGREWRPAGRGLYFSVGMPIERQCGLSAVVAGIAVVKAARRFGLELSLKWPNDLWAVDGKAGGILCETVQDERRELSLIVGIGLNLQVDVSAVTTNGWPIRDFRALGGEQLLTSVEARTAFLSAVVISLVEEVAQIGTTNPAVVQEDWARADAFFGRTVNWTSDGEGVQIGIDRGIDTQGRLMLEVPNDGALGTGQYFCLSGELCSLKTIR